MKKISGSGLVVGKKKQNKNEKLYCIGENVHSLCIGATRCDKFRNGVLPTIEYLALGGESMIISDIKGGGADRAIIKDMKIETEGGEED